MPSKITIWGVGAALAVILAIFAYRHTGEPATAKTADGANSVVATVSTDKLGKALPENTLHSARQAFARGNERDAIKLYKEYLATHPKIADAHGELGNVYYLTGRLSEAAEAYYDAANLLLEQYQFERFDELQQIIAEIKPTLADALVQKRRSITGVALQDNAPTAFGTPLPVPQQSALTRY